MRKRTGSAWFILLFLMLPILLLGLSACVRPYPESQAAASQPTPNEVATLPVFVSPPTPISTPDTGAATEVPLESAEPTPVSIEPTAESTSERTYVVVAGDTLFKIAIEHGVTVEDIAAANGIINIDSLEIGQQLLIPPPGSAETTEPSDTEEEVPEDIEPVAPTEPATVAGGVHIVQPGENLFRIGLKYGCTVEQVARHNSITTPARIYIGQEIQIPECN